MKLEKDHLYLVKRENGEYCLYYPLEDLNGDVIGWRDQNSIYDAYFEDDDIISSVQRIEERKYVRLKTFLNLIGKNNKCQIELEKIDVE
jgi:hypothetical protein